MGKGPIRWYRYPGKFEGMTEVDRVVWELCSECSSGNETSDGSGGWVDSTTLHEVDAVEVARMLAADGLFGLTGRETADLVARPHVVFGENSQGFAFVVSLASQRAACELFASIAGAFEGGES